MFSLVYSYLIEGQSSYLYLFCRLVIVLYYFHLDGCPMMVVTVPIIGILFPLTSRTILEYRRISNSLFDISLFETRDIVAPESMYATTFVL